MALVFPTHICKQFEATDQEIWETVESRSFSGKRRSLLKYRIKIFRFPMQAMNSEDIVYLKGFISRHSGRHTPFYFIDPFHPVEELEVGTGDGIETDFRLYRSYEGLYTEYPQFPSGMLEGYGDAGYAGGDLSGYGVPIQYDFMVWLDDVVQTDGYDVTTDGYLQFDYAPHVGVVVKVSFEFVYKAHFREDCVRSLYLPFYWKTDLVIETEPM
jgi:hypothetical protein